ncbi:MAG: hypothetical protein RLO38_04245 [Roseovarius confluentis]
MDLTLVNDAARAAHLVGLAIGFGVAIVADISAARMLIRPLDARETRALHRFHRMVALGLALFWSSGLVLLWLRTGFDPANFSAKLMTKLGVVTLLTINAILIGRIALPVMDVMRGRRFGGLPAGVRIQMAALGALSTAGWVSALALGVFSQMKTMEWSLLSEIIGFIYLGALILAFTAALLAPFLGDPLNRKIAERWNTSARG